MQPNLVQLNSQIPSDRPMTCSLCLMGDALVSHPTGARMHLDVDDYYVVCADSEVFPVNIPVATKVASA
jgi:hypothetical protein